MAWVNSLLSVSWNQYNPPLKPHRRIALLWLLFVRPAWAHSWRCKSSRKLTTASEVKRNCMRATDCGKEARSVNHEPMNKNQIEGGVDQGERACNRKAFVVKDQAA